MKNNKIKQNLLIENFNNSYNELTENLMTHQATLFTLVSQLIKLCWNFLYDLVGHWQELISETQFKIKSCSKCGSKNYTYRTTYPEYIFPFGRIIFTHRKVKCSKCGHKESLLRRWIPIGLENRITPMVGEMLVWLSAIMPYNDVKEHLKIFWGINISQKGIQNYVKKIGTKINIMTNLLSSSIDLPKVKWDRVYIYVDGVMAFINNKWQEVKVGIIECSRKGKTSYYYFAEKTDWKSFMTNMYKISEKLNCSQTYVKLIISDAGKGITSHINIFKEFKFLIDYFHASEHVSKWLDLMNLKSKPIIDKLRLELTSLLYKAQIKELVARMVEIRGFKKTEELVKEESYFLNHIANFNYATHRMHKWHIGSGKIESACRWLVQQRFKQSGMRWKLNGFNLILGLRLSYYNGTLFSTFQAMATGGKV
jgi:ribosomal protein L37E